MAAGCLSIMAHLMGDAAIGEGHGQAVRMADVPGHRDGLLAGGQGRVGVAEQPVCVCRPRRGMHVGPGADAQHRLAVSQLGGELQVPQPLGGHPEADRRSAHGEVGLAGELRTRIDKGQGAGRDLVAVGRAPLDEPRRPESDQAVEHGVAAAKALGESDRAFQGSLQARGRIAFPGGKRRSHRLEDLQLLSVPSAFLGHAAHDRQRFGVQPDRLGVGEPAGRDIGRAPVIGHRLPGPAGPGVLRGEQGRGNVGVAGVQQLQALSDAPVQQPAPRRADPRVRRFAQQVVGEVVAIAELPHDPSPPQLVDRPHDHVGLQVACLGKQVEAEVRPHRRRQAGHLLGCRSRLMEALAQHGRDIAGRRRRAAEGGDVAYRFDDVQREAPGCRLQQVRVGPAERLAGDRLGEACRVGRLQRAEGKLGEQPGGPHADRPGRQFRVFAQIVVAQRGGHEERRAGGQSQAERDEGQRLLVAPMGVVEHQQQRAPDGDQRSRQALEEAVPLPGIRHRPRPGRLASAAVPLRHEPADLGAPGGVEGRRRRLNRGITQPVRHRSQRQPSRRPVALGGRHHRPLLPGHPGHLGHQAGLADTGATADQHETALACRGGLPRALEQAQLGGPADEPGGRRPRTPGGRLRRRRRPLRGACVRHQALERLACGLTRGHAELTLEHRGAVVVGADGARAVSQAGLQLHQRAIADFLQRLQLDPAPGDGHRARQVARPRPRGADQIAQVHALTLKLRPGVEQPVVVYAGQEVAPVLVDSRGAVHQHPVVIAGGGRRQGGLPLGIEDAHVNAARPGVAPAQIPGRHHERTLLAQDPAQVVQLAAQVGQRLPIGGLGPEQAGDPLPGLGRPGVHGQVGDKDKRSRRPDADIGALAVGDRLPPQERHAQHAAIFS
jgi:hypothetical protein